MKSFIKLFCFFFSIIFSTNIYTITYLQHIEEYCLKNTYFTQEVYISHLANKENISYEETLRLEYFRGSLDTYLDILDQIHLLINN